MRVYNIFGFNTKLMGLFTFFFFYYLSSKINLAKAKGFWFTKLLVF